jgi:hypothetical protein
MTDASLEALGLAALRKDAAARRLSLEAQRSAVAAALADGERLAEETRRRWGADPAAAARALGLDVAWSEAEGGYGTVAVFAEYRERPPQILLYRPELTRLAAALARSGLGARLGLADPAPVFLAHELYHHLDLARGGAALARRHEVTILALGPWRWRSPIAVLPEIAAGRFAQRLLGLPFHPALLDRAAFDAARSRTEAALPG